MTEWRTIYSRAHTKEIIESLQAGESVDRDDLVVLLGFLLEADDKISALVHGNAIAATVQSPKPKILDASEVTEISGKLRQAANITRQNADDLREAHGKDIYRIEKTEPEVAAAFREETALADFLDHLADAHFGPLPRPEV